MTFQEILKFHLLKYPKSEPIDLYKLCFQSVFAGGHLINDEKKHLEFIEKECFEVKHLEEKKVEPIGNGLYRLYLDGQKLKSETIHQMVCHTAKKHTSDLELFDSNLNALCDVINNESFTSWLKNLDRKALPLVSHSATYKASYNPHYRLISQDYAFYLDLFKMIDLKLQEKTHVVMAIDGKTGSGKSRLASLLATIYDANIIHMDDFFLQQHQRTKDRFQEIGGNLDYERFHEEILLKLDKPSFAYRPFDCQIMDFSDSYEVLRKPLTIIEGSYSLRPDFQLFYDLKVFLTVHPDEQLKRIRQRSGEHMMDKFITLWIPKENIYHETYKLKEISDISFDTTTKA